MKGHPKWDAIRPQCIPPESQLRQSKNREEPANGIPTLCSTTGFWAVWELSSQVGAITNCCILLTNCCRLGVATKTVADRSQTVAICCNSSKSLDSVSRRGYGIPVEDEGINAAIICLELPCRAEERASEWLRSPAASVGSSLPYAPDRLARGVSCGTTRELSRPRLVLFRRCQARAVDASCSSNATVPSCRCHSLSS